MYKIRRATTKNWQEIEEVNVSDFGIKESDYLWKFHKEVTTEKRFVLAISDKTNQIVGTAAFFPSTVNIGGKLLPSAAVTEVGVLATHRRLGILRALLDEIFNDDEFKNAPLSALTATQATIYPRFGYSPAAFAETYELDLTKTQLKINPATAKDIEYVDPKKSLDKIIEIYDKWHEQTPGTNDRHRAH
ncbi:MAG: GNAT family N-acetyltransferase [Micrococcaceae bacterium]